LVELWQQKASVTQACRVLSVSRAGYYAAKKQVKQSTICADSVHLKAAFAKSQQTFGSRRLLTELHSKGILIGRHKIRRLMREACLVAVWKKKFISTTDSKHALPVAEIVKLRSRPKEGVSNERVSKSEPYALGL
jgi:putative transposase